MHRAQVMRHALGGLNVLDPNREKSLAVGDSRINFAFDLAAEIAMARKYNDYRPTIFDGLVDFVCVILANLDIPWRDPATDAIFFECGAGGIGSLLVLARMGDENIVGHFGDALD